MITLKCFGYSSSVHAFLIRLGFSYKKSLVVSERHRARVKSARREWFRFRLPAIQKTPERAVFIDETSVKTNLTRLRG